MNNPINEHKKKQKTIEGFCEMCRTILSILKYILIENIIYQN